MFPGTTATLWLRLWRSFWSRRLRWNSFQLSHQPQPSTASPPISSQTAGQLNLLQRFSLLRLTAIMEKHSMSNKHGWTWYVARSARSLGRALFVLELSVLFEKASVFAFWFLKKPFVALAADLLKIMPRVLPFSPPPGLPQPGQGAGEQPAGSTLLFVALCWCSGKTASKKDKRQVKGD